MHVGLVLLVSCPQNREIILDYLGGPNLIIRVLKSGRQNRDGSVAAREEISPTLLTLEMEEGALSQGMWAASRSWRRQGNSLSSRASRKEHSPANILTLAQRDLCQTSNL